MYRGKGQATSSPPPNIDFPRFGGRATICVSSAMVTACSLGRPGQRLNCIAPRGTAPDCAPACPTVLPQTPQTRWAPLSCLTMPTGTHRDTVTCSRARGLLLPRAPPPLPVLAFWPDSFRIGPDDLGSIISGIWARTQRGGTWEHWETGDDTKNTPLGGKDMSRGTASDKQQCG